MKAERVFLGAPFLFFRKKLAFFVINGVLLTFH